MDQRIEHIFNKEMKGDTSFQSTGLEILFGRDKYTKREMKENWDCGIKHGIEIGLNVASIEGQRIELNYNTKEGKNKEFLEKFYKLCDEYDCSIQYHHRDGMMTLDTKPNKH
jgi:hypothetical protein